MERVTSAATDRADNAMATRSPGYPRRQMQSISPCWRRRKENTFAGCAPLAASLGDAAVGRAQ
eukprot:7647326-Pyramimonas_sp.AAC.1